jgi:oxygen-independent coproporphyrinogen-3 oxidase
MTARDLFEKYDVPVPRYTSYPTVPHWTGAPSAEGWRDHLSASMAQPGAALALYVHLPFCESLCTFCGCNTVITRDHRREAPYVASVLAEIDLYLRALPALASTPIAEIHFGGGTPTFFQPGTLASLLDGLAARLPALRHARCAGSVEVDPRVTTAEHLELLRHRGFNRISLGIQDTAADVQDLVNRRQAMSLNARVVEWARALGYESINVDLIYGLPGQTPASMDRLGEAMRMLRPDRLAVYSFARVPWIKPAQRRFRDDQIPEGAAKRALYDVIRGRLLQDDYVEIGLDHFAAPTDGLARAAADGSLHRNFMGYTERRTSTLLGLGVSAISETPACYHHNDKVLPAYERRVAAGELPTLRGHVLTGDDRRRRAIIESLMTSFQTALAPDEIAAARDALAPLAADGLIDVDASVVRVRLAGRPFLRNIAAAFDAHLRAAPPATPTFSRAL